MEEFSVGIMTDLYKLKKNYFDKKGLDLNAYTIMKKTELTSEEIFSLSQKYNTKNLRKEILEDLKKYNRKYQKQK